MSRGVKGEDVRTDSQQVDLATQFAVYLLCGGQMDHFHGLFLPLDQLLYEEDTCISTHRRHTTHIVHPNNHFPTVCYDVT